MPLRWETWTVFLVTETLLCLTPGPAVLLVLSQALKRGSLASIWSALGILAGNGFYFVLSATSLGAILLASYGVFSVVRWAGAAYLVWLGVVTFAGRSPVLSVIPVQGGGGRRRMFVDGFVVQAANPKALVFFTALLPQFIDPAARVAAQVGVLAMTSVAVEFVVLVAYAAMAGRAIALAARPRFATLTNRLAGSLLITASVRTAAVHRS